MWFRNKETRPPQAAGMQLGPRRHSGMPRRGRPGIREHRPGLTCPQVRVLGFRAHGLRPCSGMTIFRCDAPSFRR
jgi:hypothetical protein